MGSKRSNKNPANEALSIDTEEKAEDSTVGLNNTESME